MARYFAQFVLIMSDLVRILDPNPYCRVMCRRKSRGVRRPLLEVTNTGLLQQQQQEDDSTRHQLKKKKTVTEPTVEEPVASATKTRYRYTRLPQGICIGLCVLGGRLMKSEGRGMLGWSREKGQWY
jgi:hypothetical protein